MGGCFAFSVNDEAVELVEDNTDFAIETAEIISNDEASMLRIIGKFKNIPSESLFENASDYVVSDDGRFVMQFSDEKELFDCLEKLNKNPDVIYAEQDRPVYTQAVEKSASHLSWGVKAIEADVYSQSISVSEGESVTVAIVDSGCEDIDFIKDNKTGKFICLEANTLPGMTPMSLLPQEAQAQGIEFADLCEKIIELSLLKYN